ncbi:MAG: hypothetical protein BJ554DRAFT_6655 [Olpidium bornovanus]|uniref:Retrotransposon gag domain-containing protein n=1 Tax=Olpidium bornovanus TaxID=278681 RepID=A0A8H7ZXC6_9FUNG|nr:MAG: hypothetical protein BJ554DRAFT_6655 [Olpidium bornovanus]
MVVTDTRKSRRVSWSIRRPAKQPGSITQAFARCPSSFVKAGGEKQASFSCSCLRRCGDRTNSSPTEAARRKSLSFSLPQRRQGRKNSSLPRAKAATSSLRGGELLTWRRAERDGKQDELLSRGSGALSPLPRRRGRSKLFSPAGGAAARRAELTLLSRAGAAASRTSSSPPGGGQNELFSSRKRRRALSSPAGGAAAERTLPSPRLNRVNLLLGSTSWQTLLSHGGVSRGSGQSLEVIAVVVRQAPIRLIHQAMMDPIQTQDLPIAGADLATKNQVGIDLAADQSTKSAHGRYAMQARQCSQTSTRTTALAASNGFWRSRRSSRILKKVMNLPSKLYLQVAVQNLIGDAHSLYISNKRKYSNDDPMRIRSWDDFKAALCSKFLPPDFELDTYEKLHACQQKSRSVHAYNLSFNKLAISLEGVVSESLVKQAYINRLDQRVKIAVLSDPTHRSSMEYLQSIALRMGKAIGTEKPDKSDNRPPASANAAPTNGKSSKGKSKGKGQD